MIVYGAAVHKHSHWHSMRQLDNFLLAQIVLLPGIEFSESHCSLCFAQFLFMHSSMLRLQAVMEFPNQSVLLWELQ